MVGVAGRDGLANPEQEPCQKSRIRFLIGPVRAFLRVYYAVHVGDGIRDFRNRPRCHIPFHPCICGLDSNVCFRSVRGNRSRFCRVEPQPVFRLEQAATYDVSPGLPGNRHLSIGFHGLFPLDAEFLGPERQIVTPGSFSKRRVPEHGHLGIAVLEFHGIGINHIPGKRTLDSRLVRFGQRVQGLHHAALNLVFCLGIEQIAHARLLSAATVMLSSL